MINLTRIERTFVMVKPDGVQRNLVGTILNRLERRGYCLAALKLLRVAPELAAEHYAEHVDKPFYKGLVSFITSGPVVAAVVEGRESVIGVRNLMGATDPLQAAPGTIRGDYGQDIGRNVIHGSDSPASAKREIDLYFRPEEILNYSKAEDSWVYE